MIPINTFDSSQTSQHHILQFVGVRGNGIVSLMLTVPVKNCR